MSKSSDFKESLSNLRRHVVTADPYILRGIDHLISNIASEELAFAKTNQRGMIFGRVSIIKIFCEVFDPLLVRLAKESSFVKNELFANDIALPLAVNLNAPDRCQFFAYKFETVAISFDYYLSSHPEELYKLGSKGESLKAIAEILRLMYLAIQLDEMAWCKVCFRRAVPNFDYCHIHYSSVEKSQDTDNRKAKRVFQSIDATLKQRWQSHRLQRRHGGEYVLLMANDTPAKTIYPTEAWMMVPNYIIKSVEETLKMPWPEISSGWDEALDICPEIRKRFPQAAISFSTWDDYVAALFKAIQEPIETTRHPLWVLYIIKDAEAWFNAESQLSDKRKRNTKKDIVMLFQQGLPIEDIALRLEVKKKYVLQTLRLHGYDVQCH